MNAERPGVEGTMHDSQISVDLSDRVSVMFNSMLSLEEKKASNTSTPREQLAVAKEQIAFTKEVSQIPFLTITVDYTTLEHAKFLKSLLTRQPSDGKWDFSIRATESQMKEAANIFASGVNWIKV